MWRSSAAPASAGRHVQGQKISWWEGQKGLAFLQDVQLVDGELVVPWPGLYYVYAQTYFRHTHSLEDAEEGGEEEDDRGQPLLQYIYKKVSLLLFFRSLIAYISHFQKHPDLPVCLPPGELLPSSHPADEDKPNLLLVPGIPVFPAFRPPRGAVPAREWRPPLCDCDQRHRCGHGREE